jgi:hypothetical protein
MIKNRIKLYIIILVSLLVSWYISWIAYNYLYQPKNIPLIKADNKIYKIIPEKTETLIEDNIYQSLYQKSNNVKNTRLSPEPEKPLKISNDFGSDIIEDIISGVANTIDIPEKIQLSSKLVIEADSASQPPLKKIIKSGALYLQLGAFAYENNAVDYWNQLVKEYPKIITNYTYKINVIKQKSHAVYYLMLEGVKTSSEGYSLCKKLIQNKQNCIVVK